MLTERKTKMSGYLIKDTTREENKETEELPDNQDKRVNALLWLVDKIILFIKQVFRKRK